LRGLGRTLFQPFVKLAQVGKVERCVAGIGREELLDARRRQAARKLQPQELVAPVAAEVPGHHLHPAHRVGGGPRLGCHAQQPELGRQHRPARDEGIDAGGVGVEQPQRLGVEVAQIRLGGAPHAERAHEAVGFQAGRPYHLREAPGGDAPVHLHLPQPVLGVHVAEREMRVVERAGEDVRDAESVAQHLGPGLQAPRQKLALRKGKRAQQIQVNPTPRQGHPDNS
jgi:hypothetical protein